MGWTMLYLFVFLKLPIAAACYIVGGAIKQPDGVDEVPSDGGPPTPRPPHPRRPRRPRPPRRGGPVCGARTEAPPRVRSVTAVGRARDTHPRGSSRPLGDNSQ